MNWDPHPPKKTLLSSKSPRATTFIPPSQTPAGPADFDMSPRYDHGVSISHSSRVSPLWYVEKTPSPVSYDTTKFDKKMIGASLKPRGKGRTMPSPQFLSDSPRDVFNFKEKTIVDSPGLPQITWTPNSSAFSKSTAPFGSKQRNRHFYYSKFHTPGPGSYNPNNSSPSYSSNRSSAPFGIATTRDNSPMFLWFSDSQKKTPGPSDYNTDFGEKVERAKKITNDPNIPFMQKTPRFDDKGPLSPSGYQHLGPGRYNPYKFEENEKIKVLETSSPSFKFSGDRDPLK